MPRAILALAFFLPVMLTGCACDARSWAESKAGDGAIDCGEALLGENHDDFYQCSVDAFRRGDPFFVVVDRQGTDSRARLAWASNGESVWFATYDGDPSGGDGARAEIHENGCSDPYVGLAPSSWTMISPEQEAVRCTGTPYHEKVCP